VYDLSATSPITVDGVSSLSGKSKIVQGRVIDLSQPRASSSESDVVDVDALYREINEKNRALLDTQKELSSAEKASYQKELTIKAKDEEIERLKREITDVSRYEMRILC
jgi:putative IMPACT (imprinted ancient) family translation regulator